MRKLSILLLLLAFVGVAAQAQDVEGNGKFKSETRSVSSFTALSIAGGFEVELTQGTAPSLKLEAEENVLPLIESTVQNGTLTIKMKKGIKNARTLKVFVTVQDLKKLQLAGGIKLRTTNTLSAPSLALEFAGGINAVLALQVKELAADFAGGTKVTLSGRADKVTMDLAGATNLKALELKTNYLTLDAAGASSAQVSVAKELTVDAAGIVTVDYKGSPKVSHSGMGKIRRI
ncbi:head GIN domain-containing protein [Rufibacter soli]|jgi:hypothetical protein